MNIVPIAAFDDNYIWLLQHQHLTVCVDPGDAQPVLASLNAHDRCLDAVFITHHHRDHVGGLDALKQAFPEVVVYGPAGITEVTHAVAEGDSWSMAGLEVRVWDIPGHTHNHIAYVINREGEDQQHVFCGDTLFSGGCGRVFCGTISQLQASLARLQSLPAQTLFYPAHEYTASNLRFAMTLEPDNVALAHALAQANQTPTLPVTLAHEQAINPFLRLHSRTIKQSVAAQCMAADSDASLFASLRQLKNQF